MQFVSRFMANKLAAEHSSYSAEGRYPHIAGMVEDAVTFAEDVWDELQESVVKPYDEKEMEDMLSMDRMVDRMVEEVMKKEANK